jgi:hypothetical protein
LHRPVEGNSPGERTVIDTATAIPAFIGMQYHWWFAFLWIGYEYVYLADFNASIASVTDIGIENYRISGTNDIWQCIYLFLKHDSSPYSP